MSSIAGAVACMLLTACVQAAAPPAPVPSPGPSSAAAAPEPLALMVPVHGVSPSRVPDTFNAPRAARPHRAVDIPAARGTPVVAAAPGRVYRLRNTPAGGLSVYVADTAGQWMFYYAHLDGFRDGLTEGTKLAQGEVVGYVGTTGNAPKDVPHLHFQLMRTRRDNRWWDGEAVDPRPYFVVPGSQR